MEACVRCTVLGDVQVPGSVTVPARTFNSIVRELPADRVDLDFSGALAGIACGGNQYQLTTQTPEDFPNWPDLQAALRKLNTRPLRAFFSERVEGGTPFDRIRAEYYAVETQTVRLLRAMKQSLWELDPRYPDSSIQFGGRE